MAEDEVPADIQRSPSPPQEQVESEALPNQETADSSFKPAEVRPIP